MHALHVLTNGPACVQEGKWQSRGRQACHPSSRQGLPPLARTHTHEYHYRFIDTTFWAFLSRANTRIHRHSRAPALSLTLKQGHAHVRSCAPLMRALVQDGEGDIPFPNIRITPIALSIYQNPTSPATAKKILSLSLSLSLCNSVCGTDKHSQPITQAPKLNRPKHVCISVGVCLPYTALKLHHQTKLGFTIKLN